MDDVMVVLAAEKQRDDDEGCSHKIERWQGAESPHAHVDI